MTASKMNDERIELMVSKLLRIGVLTAGIIVFLGGVYYLARHGAEVPHYSEFQGQPSIDRILPQIVAGAISLRARSIIQFGLLILIATPIARVILCMVGFALERDRRYVFITSIVLAVLLFSLITGAAGG